MSGLHLRAVVKIQMELAANMLYLGSDKWGKKKAGTPGRSGFLPGTPGSSVTEK